MLNIKLYDADDEFWCTEETFVLETTAKDDDVYRVINQLCEEYEGMWIISEDESGVVHHNGVLDGNDVCELLEKYLLEFLPSGSGFNSGWSFDFDGIRRTRRAAAKARYDYMSPAGMYGPTFTIDVEFYLNSDRTAIDSFTVKDAWDYNHSSITVNIGHMAIVHSEMTNGEPDEERMNPDDEDCYDAGVFEMSAVIEYLEEYIMNALKEHDKKKD